MSLATDLKHAAEALALITTAINAAKFVRSGGGYVVCPKCQDRLQYSFKRTGKGMRVLTFAAACITFGCISFKGH